jgi:ADP-ribose pyrophosphatase
VSGQSDKNVVDLAVESDQIVGREPDGFMAIRRVRLRNRYADGGTSERYVCDFIDRPMGLDAVVVCVYWRGPDGRVEVLLRDGLRPALRLARGDAPVADARPYLFFRELVAGIVEQHDVGEAGIRRRAAEEVLEEAGYRVSPDDVVMLGAGTFPTAGAMPEKFWLTAVEIADKAAQEPLAGDGSPMEEGASTRWMELGAAIRACVDGELEDMKTELSLRRLAEQLA